MVFEGEFIDRVIELKNWMLEKIEEYDEEYIEVALEEIQEQSNVQTFKMLAMVQAILLVALREKGIKFHLVYSSQWKSLLGIKGKGRTEQKRNAQAYVMNCYGKKVTQDEADAICIGEYITRKIQNWGP